jgi:hypothetical protein
MANILRSTLLVCCISVLTDKSFADGCFVRTNYDVNIYAPDQKAVISFNDARQTMILSTKLQSDRLDDFGWIIPIKTPAKPEVELAKARIFLEMSHFFDPPGYGKGFGFGCAAALERKELDNYDITILRASDEEALYEWLTKNDFKLDESAKAILKHYTNEDFYFVTAKLDLRNKHSRHIDLLGKYNLYEAAEQLATKEAAQMMYYDYARRSQYAQDILQSALAQAEYRTHWRNLIGSDEYYQLRSGLAGASGNKTALDAAIENVTDIIFELHAGIADPLKISFDTDEVFFPLRISRINPGDVNILLYLFSSTRMIDPTKLLTLSDEKKVDEHLQHKLKEDLDVRQGQYVSKFVFRGPSSKFTRDIRLAPRNANLLERILEPMFIGW